MTEMEISAEEFDRMFDNGEDISAYVDWDNVELKAPGRNAVRQINVAMPAWLVDVLDAEAARRGITRKAVINTWLVDRADAEFGRDGAA